MAYTLSAIVTKVQKRIRDTGYSSSTIKEFINDEQNDVANEYLLRFWEADVQTYTLTADVQDITNGAGLPATFVNPISLRITTDGYEKKLNYVDYDDLEDYYPDQSGDTSGTPRYWTYYGDTIEVYPKPNSAYTLKMRFTRRPTELSADADVPELPREFEEILVYGAAQRALEEKDMDDKAATFEQKKMLQRQRLVQRYGLKKFGQSSIMRLNRRRYATSFFR